MKTAFDLSHEIPQRTSTEHDYEFRARAEKWIENVVQLNAAKSALELAANECETQANVSGRSAGFKVGCAHMKGTIKSLRTNLTIEQLEKK